MRSQENVTGVILAGGAGRRMGGQDKGLQSYKGRPLIEYVLERIRPQVAQILIVANRNQITYEHYGYPVVADQQEGFHGPLMGMVSALPHVTTALMQVLPCDMPKLPLNLVNRLNEALLKPKVQAAFPRHNAQNQPLLCLLHCKSIRETLLSHLEAENNRSVIGFLQSLPHVAVDFPETSAHLKGGFLNVNNSH